MSKTPGVILAILLSSTMCLAQFHIGGKVTTDKNIPLEGVNIGIKGAYEGTTSAQDGVFSFSVSSPGRFVLVFSMTGYKTTETDVEVTDKLTTLNIQLKEAITDLKAVVITAGTFEASDKKRTSVLKSVDMVTTAGQQADIVAALKTLPGAQQVGEQEGLFVRGGTGNETKVFIDGMMVNSPFFSSVPGIAQRSRFSPLLFKGTAFSSGGYSAQYGQALSSVLLLESIDLPSRSEVNLILSSPQISLLTQRLNKKKNESLGLNINYMNLRPYFNIVPQKYHHAKPPEALNTEVNFRKKTRNGMLKFYGYGSTNTIAFQRPGLDYEGSRESFQLRNGNAFANFTYTAKLQSNWQLYTGTSFSYNRDVMALNTANADTTYLQFKPELTNHTTQAKVVLTKSFPGLSKLYWGAELQDISDKVQAKDSIPFTKIEDRYLAGFIEADIYFSSRLVSKLGTRLEHSSLLKQAALSPRLSLAYKLSDRSQFSFAYGIFYQKPETPYLLRKQALDFTRATHYILNYQKVYNGQTLRIEGFYKKYNHLITTQPNDPFAIKNEGTGYAKGIELFWRDKTHFKNMDYWVSYSYLDTRRKYLDYPTSVQPSFAARHTANLVAKRWLNKLSTQFSATYTYASGRPYHNPNKGARDFMAERTINLHSLGLQANYLKTFGHINAVFILNVSNVLGGKQVFSYRYGTQRNSDRLYARDAVTPLAKRFIFLGVYLSIGADRRKNILD